MNLYEGIKDLAKIIQQADNIELNRQLLELEQIALDMQEEIRQLKQENNELKKRQQVEEKMERHEQPFFTLKGDNTNIRYCTTCWGSSNLVIQLNCDRKGQFECPHCQASGIYDKKLYDDFQTMQFKMIASLNS